MRRQLIEEDTYIYVARPLRLRSRHETQSSMVCPEDRGGCCEHRGYSRSQQQRSLLHLLLPTLDERKPVRLVVQDANIQFK